MKQIFEYRKLKKSGKVIGKNKLAKDSGPASEKLPKKFLWGDYLGSLEPPLKYAPSVEKKCDYLP